jgi:hypothetical protein
VHSVFADNFIKTLEANHFSSSFISATLLPWVSTQTTAKERGLPDLLCVVR